MAEPTFLSIPQEMRDEIYGYLLVAELPPRFEIMIGEVDELHDLTPLLVAHEDLKI